MHQNIAPEVVTAIQAITEAVRAAASELPAAQREKVERALQRAQAARAAIMADGME